jgi:hypothetical protein
MNQKKYRLTARVVTVIASHVFLSGFSFRKTKLIIAASIGDRLIMIKVFATFVFSIEITKRILVMAKVKT